MEADSAGEFNWHMKGHNRPQPQPPPPTLAIRILRWFCPDELLEGILFDFQEQYAEAIVSSGKRKAKQLYYWNVIRLFHPSIFLRNKITMSYMNIGLIKSHLLVASRSMTKFKFYSIVNILGLSMAVTFILLVFLFVKKEMGYDNFHKNGANIYRVAMAVIKKETGEVTSRSAITSVPVGNKLLDEVPAVVAATRYASSTVTIIKNNVPSEEVAYFVDPGFLKIFDFPVLNGSDQALGLKSSIVISRQKAVQYFGDIDPIGKTLTFNMNDSISSFTIQAVIDGKSDQSSLKVDFLVPFEAYSMLVPQEVIESYNYGILENYVLLQPNTLVEEAEWTSSNVLNFNPDDDSKVEVIFQPLSSIHLENDIVGNAAYTNPTKLLIMIGLVFLVFIVSVINFITLSTGHALVRLKEIGLRKVLGAHKSMLRFQLLIEAFALSFLASMIGLILAWVMLPVFNQLVDTQIKFIPTWDILLVLVGISALVALVNGGLQSLVLVDYQVINALHGNVSSKSRSGFFSQSLVVVQFTISTVLIIGTIIIRSQMQYVQNKDLGFEKNNLIQISLGNSDDTEAAKVLVARLKTQSLSNSRISSVTASMNNSSEPWTTLTFRQIDETDEKLCYNLVSNDYLVTMGVELLEGEFFDEKKGNPSTDIVVNESLVRHFGWDNPLEQQIPGKDFNESHRIIGVVKDFHFNSLRSKVDPLILTIDSETILDGVGGLSTYMWPPNLYQLYVRFTPGEIPPIIDHLSELWKQGNPNIPFTYSFVDEMVARQYREEKRWGDIVNAASIFAIFIAWMGLIGLTRLSVQRRTKEIGIRKVLGSSTIGVTSLLSKKFLLLVLGANLIAWPISYWLADSWLTSFTYRVAINPLIFLISGVSVVGLVTLSIGLQSLIAARTNPVESLKYE